MCVYLHKIITLALFMENMEILEVCSLYCNTTSKKIGRLKCKQIYTWFLNFVFLYYLLVVENCVLHAHFDVCTLSRLHSLSLISQVCVN